MKGKEVRGGSPGRPLEGAGVTVAETGLKWGRECWKEERKGPEVKFCLICDYTQNVARWACGCGVWGAGPACHLQLSPVPPLPDTHTIPTTGKLPIDASVCRLNPSASPEVKLNTFAPCPAWHKRIPFLFL